MRRTRLQVPMRATCLMSSPSRHLNLDAQMIEADRLEKPANHRRRLHADSIASMRPRLIASENVGYSASLLNPCFASMKPSLIASENWRATRSTCRPWCCFNEAEAHRLGKPQINLISTAVNIELQ